MNDEKPAAHAGNSESTGTPVWDWGVRIFHWSLAVCVTFSIYTGLTGGLWQMDWHMRSGYAILGLVIFRVIWGVIGGRHARFHNFVRGPLTVLRYAADFVRGRDKPAVGHNPLGGWSVVLILLAVGAQAVTGLFANDDIFIKGPLADLVGKEQSDVLTAWHHWIKYPVWGLIGLHLSAIAVHWLKGENLIPAMLHGRKHGIDPVSGDAGFRPVLLLIATAAAAAAVFGILNLA